MKLLIIQPSHYRGRSDRRLHKTRRRTLVPLTLPYLAALTPRHWQVALADEQLTEIDFNAPVDLVAITTWTINSLRAYEVADRFRERGIPVIMGGPHTFFYSQEAARHCDAVGIGEGEEIWPVMLADAARGRLEKFYGPQTIPDLKGLPLPRYDLLDLRPFGWIKTHSVQSSRGCIFKCDFCSERFYVGPQYRHRPVADIVEEIKAIRAKNIFFADSNFAGKIRHNMLLMEALIPLKVRWSALWPAYLCMDGKFMDLAKRSGLLHVNIGFESLDGETLAGMNKKANKVRNYRKILENLRKRGISFSLNFIFGWDTEGRNVFDATLAFLKENKVPVAYFNILTPHRGTPFYDRMQSQNRILDADQIGRWPGTHCHIRPSYCSARELEEAVIKMQQVFYSYPSMFSRLSFPLTRAHIANWLLNLSQRKVAQAAAAMECFDTY